MGGESSRNGPDPLASFAQPEKERVRSLYKEISGMEKNITEARFKHHLENVLPSPLSHKLFHEMIYISKPLPLKETITTMSEYDFCVGVACLVRGMADEQVKFLKHLASTHRTKQVNAKELYHLVEELANAYLTLLTQKSDILKPAYLMPAERDMKQYSTLLAQSILYELYYPNPRKRPRLFSLPEESSVFYTDNDLYKWFTSTTLLSHIFIYTFEHVFPVKIDHLTPCSLPTFNGKTHGTDYINLLTLPAVCMLRDSINKNISDTWTLLFDSRVHGESYNTMVRKIKGHRNVILILKDDQGCMFGGFITATITNNANFQGTSDSFLFMLYPSMCVYRSSGLNENYFYLNTGTETLPNGMGMGGQFEYFGFWLEQEYGHGISMAKPTSTTYHSPQLSAEQNFKYTDMEVWRVTGEEDRNALEDAEDVNAATGGTSVLDSDPESKAILELIGKGHLSDGLRDSDPTASSPEKHDL